MFLISVFQPKWVSWVLLRKTSISTVVLAMNCLTCGCPPSSLIYLVILLCIWFSVGKWRGSPLVVYKLSRPNVRGSRVVLSTATVSGRRDLFGCVEHSWEQWQLPMLLGPSERKVIGEGGIKSEAFTSLAVVFKSTARDNPQKCGFLAYSLLSFSQGKWYALGLSEFKELRSLCI